MDANFSTLAFLNPTLSCNHLTMMIHIEQADFTSHLIVIDFHELYIPEHTKATNRRMLEPLEH